MMQFILDRGIYKVARVTGPQHNFLGIGLDGAGGPVDVVALPARTGERSLIWKDMVLEQVVNGLREINDTLGKDYSISKVFFVPTDTPSTSVYKLLTVELIKRIDSQEAFLDAPSNSSAV